MVKKSGLREAIEVTTQITNHLTRVKDKQLYTNLVHSIFDDQLKIYTNFNRQQRHNALKKLKKAMKNRDSE